MTPPSNIPDAGAAAHGDYLTGGLALAVGLGCLGNGLSCYIQGWRSLRIARDSVRWPQVPGRITKSVVGVSVHTSYGSKTYAPEITYAYLHNGIEQTSNRVIATSFRLVDNQAWAQQWVDAYPVGAEVMVYVNPRRHQESVLAPGLEISEASCRKDFAGGGFLLILGILAIAFGLWTIAPR